MGYFFSHVIYPTRVTRFKFLSRAEIRTAFVQSPMRFVYRARDLKAEHLLRLEIPKRINIPSQDDLFIKNLEMPASAILIRIMPTGRPLHWGGVRLREKTRFVLRVSSSSSSMTEFDLEAHLESKSLGLYGPPGIHSDEFCHDGLFLTKLKVDRFQPLGLSWCF